MHSRSVAVSASWRIALVALAALALSCQYGATEVLVTLDTDAPIDRTLDVALSLRWGLTTVGDAGTLQLARGGPSSTPHRVELPATFGLTPPGPSSAHATLVIDATLEPGTTTDAPIAFRRIVRFTFQQHSTLPMRVFLSVACGTAAVGCTSVSADACTVSALCEEQGLTCGDNGSCVSQTVAPVGDAGLMATLADASVMRIDASPTDVPTDIPTPMDITMDTCTSCGTRNCGTDSCGRSCGTCTAPDTCDSTGHCICSRQCAGKQCGPDGCGGSCGTCPVAGSACTSAGLCNSCVTHNDCVSCATDGDYCGWCRATGTCLQGPSSGAGVCSAGWVYTPSGCCVPNCSGRQCGSNGCGGSCGACPTNATCNGSYQCVCDAGFTLCGGSCVVLGSDPNNCGSCGTVCSSGICCNTVCCLVGDHCSGGTTCL